MSIISRIKVWGSEVLKSSDLNGEFNNLINFINNVDSGTTVWDNVKVTTLTPVTNNIGMGGLKLTGLSAGSAAGDSVRYEQLFSGNYWGYRRPVLQYNSSTVVNIETGINGTSGQLAILFPDGTYRTDSTAGRIQCNLAQNAALTVTAQSGLRTGSQTANTWYAIYAVKSQVNTTDIVAVADTVLPLQANFATLNSNFGTNSWVYLGMVANGDNSAATTVVLKFSQAGNFTRFRNSCAGNALGASGIRLATTASAASLTFTYASGTNIATPQIPNQLTIGNYAVSHGAANADDLTASDSAGVYNLDEWTGTIKTLMRNETSVLSDGVKMIDINSTTIAMNIFLTGFWDGVLGVGPNPIL